MKRPHALFPALLLVLALVLVLPLASTGCSSGSNFPSKPVELVVVFAAGGSSDVLMRSLAEAATKELGQQVVVVNKPGGSGTIGTGEVARAKPDGYQVLLMQAGPGATQPHMDQVPYSIDDFEPLMQVFRNPAFCIVGAKTPWKNAKEFAEDAKKRPGEIAFGASPQGGVPHLVMEQFGKAGGFTVKTVPFQGGAPAMTALLGGHIDVITDHPPLIATHLPSGNIKVLGVYEEKRLPEFPDIPTMREQGFDAVGSVWGGLVVPKGTPKDVQTKLHDAFKKALESESVKAAWANLKLPPTYASGADLIKLWKYDYEMYGSLIGGLKQSGRL